MLPVTEKLIKQLEKTKLPAEDRAGIIGALVAKVSGLPIDTVISVTNAGVNINGMKLDVEQVVQFKEGCVALENNQARKLINQQIRYLAIVEGVHKGLTPDQILFSKAALWVMEQEARLIEQIMSS